MGAVEIPSRQFAPDSSPDEGGRGSGAGESRERPGPGTAMGKKLALQRVARLFNAGVRTIEQSKDPVAKCANGAIGCHGAPTNNSQLRPMLVDPHATLLSVTLAT